MKVVTAILLFSLTGLAEVSFSSGSTGADGDLHYSAPPPARRKFVMAYHAARSEMLLFGGNASGRQNDTWVYDGSSWELRTPQTFPAPRDEASMAYDSARERVVLFGGFDQSINDEAQDTWEWNGVAWNRIDTAISPPARQRASFCFDSQRNVIVLFGGDRDGSPLADTWEYDGSNWRQISTASSPGALTDASITYDPVRQKTLLFGGSTSGGPSGSRDQTWVYDGANWSQLSPSGVPPARMAHVAAWNASRGSILMGFGVSGFGARNDFWEWNGSEWTVLSPGTVPALRSDCGMAFHDTHNGMLLFGGNGAASLLDDTWLFTTDWALAEGVQSAVVFDMGSRADGVWHYRDISVPAGVSLTVRANAANTPITWLASGLVSIAGSIDLSGAQGQPGPGGFVGGAGGVQEANSGHPGLGPGGGLPGIGAGAPGIAGAQFGAPEAAPIAGGSGGGGGGAIGAEGGGGGGAILIAANAIEIDGSIEASGGTGAASTGGDGADGSIKLVAHSIGGGGSLSAGRIRFETFSSTFVGSASTAISGSFPAAMNYAAHLSTMPTVRVVSVQTSGGEIPVPESAELDFAESGPVTINLVSTNVPVGTVLTVRVTARGQVHMVDSSQTDAAGNATATLTVPAGLGTIQAFAEFAIP